MPVDDLKRAVLLHELRNNGGKPDVDARVALNAILMAGSAPKHGLDDDERQELEELVRQRPYDAEVIPAKFLLNPRDVTRVMRGASLHVIQPQSYDGITTLDNSSFMFGEDAGDALRRRWSRDCCVRQRCRSLDTSVQRLPKSHSRRAQIQCKEEQAHATMAACSRGGGKKPALPRG